MSNSTFLTFCGKPDLKLRITLDTRNDVMESNELNNVEYINGVTLTDGNADFCSSKLLFGGEGRYQLMYCDSIISSSLRLVHINNTRGQISSNPDM